MCHHYRKTFFCFFLCRLVWDFWRRVLLVVVIGVVDGIVIVIGVVVGMIVLWD